MIEAENLKISDSGEAGQSRPVLREHPELIGAFSMHGPIPEGIKLVFVGEEPSGFYTNEDAAREGLLIRPGAYGQRIYRVEVD